MPTAEQLLASLSEVDRTFVIDNDLRAIRIPSTITNLGVESDDEVLTVYFQMPATYCGIDLSKFHIRINYLNAASEGDYHDVHDARVQPDGTIMFSWTIGRHAASVIGNVEFNVCLKLTDSTGKVLKEFNTTPARLPILKGLEVSEQVISEYTDILEQWRARLFGVGDTEEAKILAVSQQEQQVISTKSAEVLSDIELKTSESLATIPETYTEVYNMADEAIRTKADAIVLETSGSVISVDDGSDDHLRNLKVFGRTTQAKTTGAQLAYISDVDAYENNGIVWSSNGGVITAKGSASIHSYTPSHIHADLKGLVGTFYLSGNGKHIKVAAQYTRDGVTSYVNAPQEFTLDGSETRVELYCQITTYNVDIDDVAYPMVNVGGTALPWESYTGGKPSPNPEYPQELVSVENPIISIYGKNLYEFNHDVNRIPASTGSVIEVFDNGVIVQGNDGSAPGSTGYSSGWYQVGHKKPIHIKAGTIATFSADYTVIGNPLATTANILTVISGTNNYSINGFVARPADGVTTRISQTAVVEKDDDYLFVLSLNSCKVRIENIQVALSNTDANYEPYKPAQSLPLNHTLYGIPVSENGNYTDENGQQWICDEVDLERGVYVQRITRLVFDGTENWGLYDFQSTYSGFSLHGVLDEIHSRSHGMSNQFHNFKQSVDDGIWLGVGNTSLYAISKEWHDKGLDAWKAHLSKTPLEVIYPRITPIETQLTSDEILAFRQLKTNHPNTTVLNDASAWVSIKYAADTKSYAEHPRVLKLTDSRTGVVYELKIVDGNITASPI